MKRALAFLNPLHVQQSALPRHLVTVIGSVLLLGTGAFLGGRTAITNASLPLVVDVSSVGQGYLSCTWFNNAAASGVTGFILKAGGDDVGEYEDYWYPHNVGCARATGRRVGTYFFTDPYADSASTQAQHYASILNANGGVRTNEATMDDLEIGTGNLAGFASTFDSTMSSLEGVKPLLYSYQSFFYNHGLAGNSTVSGSSFLNDANWYFGTPPGSIPNWPQLTVWQFSDSGCTAGVCPIDQNYLVASSWPGKPAPPAPAPPPPSPPPTTTSGCSFGTSAWTANPWWNGDGNQQTTVYKYSGSVSCASPQFSYGIQYKNSAGTWVNVCSPSLGTCWDPWTTRTSDFWSLSYYTTPCGRLYRAMVAIRSGTGKVAGYKQVGSWVINRDCA